jgi:hypothetical protein
MLRKIGCLVVLALGAWFGWMLRDRLFSGLRPASETTAATSAWEPLTPEGSARMRAALETLQKPRGPVFATVRAGDLASYVLQQLVKQLPPSADSIEAAALGDRLYVRASVKPADFGGSDILGSLSGFLSDRERMQFGGSFHILRPGLAEFRVQEIRLHDFPIPPRAIPKLLRRIERGARPAGLSPDGLPLVVPDYINDVRVEPGKITLFKSTP